jgi:ferredoxin
VSHAPEPVRRYRVWIDNACIGSGQCELIEPRRFAVGDASVAVVIGEPERTVHGGPAARAEPERQLAALRTAESNCPIGAIHVDEVT